MASEKYKMIPEVVEQILNGKSEEGLRAWFEQVDRIRRSIVNISTLIERVNESPNAYYGVLPFDGSLVLCESYGNPHCFYTPLGKWAITGGGWNDGKEATDLLDSLGIKWTRIKEPVDNTEGSFGGLIQIDEDQCGNKYPPVNPEIAFNMNPFYFTTGKNIFYDYHTSTGLFERINQSDLLRKERD